MENKKLYNLEEVAKQARIKVPTLRSWIYGDKIPVVRMGRRVLIKAEVLEILLTKGLAGIEERKQELEKLTTKLC